MKMTIEFDMDNAAFTDWPEKEIERILHKIASDVTASDVYYRAIMDTNGNRIGYVEIK